MALIETVTRIRASGGTPVERLEAHPALPLVAGWDSERPAVHVWSFEARELRELATVGGELAPYGDAIGWKRRKREPAVAWHPDQPLLLVVNEGAVRRWTPVGISAMDRLRPLLPIAIWERRRATIPPSGTAPGSTPGMGVSGLKFIIRTSAARRPVIAGMYPG